MPHQIVLIVPCYNEASRWPEAEVWAYLSDHPELELQLVDDGSTDGTGEVLARTAARFPTRVRVLGLQPNRGKAEAVRAGVLETLAQREPDLIGYWDADLAAPLSELPRLAEVFESRPEVDLAMAARVKLSGTRIHRRWYRHVLGRLFATAASLLLDLGVYDTQCGAKLMTREMAARVFQDPFISRWIFDVEILARNGLAGPRGASRDRVIEVPVQTWCDVAGSKVRPRHFFKAAYELGRIWGRYRPEKSPSRTKIISQAAH